jgi:hypothetical protein
LFKVRGEKTLDIVRVDLVVVSHPEKVLSGGLVDKKVEVSNRSTVAFVTKRPDPSIVLKSCKRTPYSTFICRMVVRHKNLEVPICLGSHGGKTLPKSLRPVEGRYSHGD